MSKVVRRKRNRKPLLSATTALSAAFVASSLTGCVIDNDGSLDKNSVETQGACFSTSNLQEYENIKIDGTEVDEKGCADVDSQKDSVHVTATSQFGGFNIDETYPVPSEGTSLILPAPLTGNPLPPEPPIAPTIPLFVCITTFPENADIQLNGESINSGECTSLLDSEKLELTVSALGYQQFKTELRSDSSTKTEHSSTDKTISKHIELTPFKITLIEPPTSNPLPPPIKLDTLPIKLDTLPKIEPIHIPVQIYPSSLTISNPLPPPIYIETTAKVQTAPLPDELNPNNSEPTAE